jgi:Putative zinc-finger
MTTGRDDIERAGLSADCEVFATTVSEYLDGTLAPDATAAASAHAASCDRCRSLAAELESIRAAARALPVQRPSRDLWAGIEARIRVGGVAAESPSHRSSRPAAARAQARWFGARWVNRNVVAAAALVVMSVGLTFTATKWWIARNPTVVASGNSGHARIDSSAPTMATPVANQDAATSEFLYDHQITALHQILQQRRTQLDPKTVAVLDRNLAIIDSAIVQSRAALAQDPASAFLAGQLDQALSSKLELLRTAALLPSRT